MTVDRVIFWPWEGAGYAPLPGERNIAHADPEWFQRDLDDEYEDPDEEWPDPLPTLRHRQLPD